MPSAIVAPLIADSTKKGPVDVSDNIIHINAIINNNIPKIKTIYFFIRNLLASPNSNFIFCSVMLHSKFGFLFFFKCRIYHHTFITVISIRLQSKTDGIFLY